MTAQEALRRARAEEAQRKLRQMSSISLEEFLQKESTQFLRKEMEYLVGRLMRDNRAYNVVTFRTLTVLNNVSGYTMILSPPEDASICGRPTYDLLHCIRELQSEIEKKDSAKQGAKRPLSGEVPADGERQQADV